MSLAEWFKRASATFSAVALALGIFAIGFALWVPSKFADLSADIKQNTQAIIGIDDGLTENLQISKNIEGAVTDALLSTEESDELIGYLAANLDTENKVVFSLLESSVPVEMWSDWRQSGKLRFLKASLVNEKEYLFVDRNNMNQFTSEEQQTLKEISEIKGFSLKYRDHKDFPGYSVQFMLDALMNEKAPK